MEDAFNINENPRPLDLINKENLRAFRLAPMEELQGAPMVVILAIIAPLVAIESPSGDFEPSDFFHVATFHNSCYFTIHLFLFM